MRKLLYLVLVCLPMVTLAQDCTRFVAILQDSTFSFRKDIRANGENVSLFITGFTYEKVIAVVFILDDKKGCVTKGDSITLIFGDGVVHEAVNNFGPNCEGKYALFLSESSTPENALNKLTSYNMISIKIRQNGQDIVHAVNTSAAEEIRNSLQ